MTREEAIDILTDIRDDVFAPMETEEMIVVDELERKALSMAIEALEQEPCDDCISRQAVKDIICSGVSIDTDADKEYVCELIDKLPSVTPKEKTGWIPVSEKLPKHSEVVLLSLPPRRDNEGIRYYASVICGHYIGGKGEEWGISDGETVGYGLVKYRKGINPIAWMPLPAPFEPQESEDKE